MVFSLSTSHKGINNYVILYRNEMHCLCVHMCMQQSQKARYVDIATVLANALSSGLYIDNNLRMCLENAEDSYTYHHRYYVESIVYHQRI